MTSTQTSRRSRNVPSRLPESFEGLWRYRFRQFAKEVGKYGRLIVNDHFSIMILVLLAFFAMYYQEALVLIGKLESNLLEMTLKLLMSIILLLTTSLGRPIWLTEEADKSYLFGQGSQWQSYWLKGTLVGLVIPIIVSVLMTSLLFPFLAILSDWASHHYFLLIFMIVSIHILNFMVSYINSFQDKKISSLSRWLVCFMIITCFIFLNSPLNLWGSFIGVLGWGIYVLYRYFNKSESLIQFEYVVEEENKRKSSFYKWISMFADVPQIIPAVKRREWLDLLLSRLKFLWQDAYGFQLVRLLFRHSDYSGVWLRVMIFIAFLMIWLKSLWLLIGLGLVSHLLTLIQLLPLLTYNKEHPVQSLYPIRVNRAKSFTKVMRLIFVVQCLVYGLVSLNPLALIIWLIGGELLLRLYIPYKETKLLKN